MCHEIGEGRCSGECESSDFYPLNNTILLKSFKKEYDGVPSVGKRSG